MPGHDVGFKTSLAMSSSWLPAVAAAPTNSGSIKAGSFMVYKVLAANSNTSGTFYFQIFDTATPPANGTAPRLPTIPLPALQTVMLDFGTQPLSCSLGLSWAASTTVATKTESVDSPLQVSAEVS